MSLIKCHECGGQVSSAAKACPHCGAKPRKKVGIIGIFFALFIGYIAFSCSSGLDRAQRNAQERESAKTPEQKAAEAKAKEDEERRFKSARNAIRALQSTLKDPASLDIEAIGVTQGGGLTCISYRAKNSFNAVIKGGFVFDGSTGSSHDATVAKNCDPKRNKFIDTTYAK